MERLHVFVDEFGDPHLDTSKDGVSSTYIVAAVCVRDRALTNTTAAAEAIRSKHFQQGEMKSSGVGPNDGRRLQIIRDLAKVDCFVIAFCAQKKNLNRNTGLEFKKSFIKFFASSLYKRISRCADSLQVLIDEHGSEVFQDELRKYLLTKLSGDMFSDPTFEFSNSKDHPLLQAADFFAGSLARVYDDKKQSDRYAEIKSALASKVSVALWPSGREEGCIPSSEFFNEDDENVRRYCIRRAEEYLDGARNDTDDRDEIARVVFLDSLIAHHTTSEPGEFLSTVQLKKEISSRLGEPISDHRFRSAVVAKLRDADVVISSCSRGYRLPSSIGDILEFATFASSIASPIVLRVSRARRGIREATLGRVDMLEGPQLASLRSMAECLD